MRKALQRQSYDIGALFDLHFTERRGHPVRGGVASLGIRKSPRSSAELDKGADEHKKKHSWPKDNDSLFFSTEGEVTGKKAIP